MRALFFDNQDYLLHLLDGEFSALRGSPLETSLVHAFKGDDMGKKVTLEVSKNEGFDGIELKYVPKDAKSWGEIKEIRVKINEEAYSLIGKKRIAGTRYNSNAKVDIEIVPEHFQ